MIPNAEQLLAISQMSRGDLAEVPFSILLQALAVHRRSLVLSLERRQLKKDVVLENGIVVDCHSNLLHDTVGKFMVGRGELSELQYQQTLTKSASTGRSLADILVADELVSADDLYKTLQLNLATKLLDVFTWRNGTFSLVADLPEVHSSLKVRAPQLILTGVLKFVPEAEIVAAMADLDAVRFLSNPRPGFPLKELRFAKDHQEILDVASGRQTLAELAAQSGMPKSRVERLVYALAVIGVILPEDRVSPAKVATLPEVGFASDGEPGAQSRSAEMTSEEVRALRNEVMETYLQYRKLDAFELLGVPEEADRDATEKGYLDYCRKFAPWRFDHPALHNLEEKARDLFVAGGRAFGELCNPETRNSLVARRNSRFEQRLSTNEARNAFVIRSNLLDAETQFNKGVALMKQGRLVEAVEQLEFAHDCEPQNSVYRAELAYCRYLKDPLVEKDHAVKELSETLRIDPDCGMALYYCGLVHGESGEFAQAEPLLQKAIKLVAPDRRPIDALKKFRSAEKEKSRKRKFFRA